MIAFEFAKARFVALPSGGLWWPQARLLCVADLHLGKSQRMARRGGALLPPYEVSATLTKLESDIAQLNPARLVCLGDSFDDLAAAEGLDDDARRRLIAAQAAREWLWIEGNHDAGAVNLAGQHLAELSLGGMIFRHIAAENPNPAPGEISGHYHPKARLAGQGWPAFLLGQNRLILPAYGTYTGGLWADHPPLPALMGPKARALVLRAGKVLEIPLPRR